MNNFFERNVATLRWYFSMFPIVYIFIIPVITMKSWAEEKKTGTAELLFTMPFTEWDLVLGKFFSILTLLVSMLVLTVPIPLMLSALGDFEAGVIFAEYLGAFLLGASAIALGLLMSSLSKNQAGAFRYCLISFRARIKLRLKLKLNMSFI